MERGCQVPNKILALMAARGERGPVTRKAALCLNGNEPPSGVLIAGRSCAACIPELRSSRRNSHLRAISEEI